MIDRSGQWWTGTDPAGVEDYIRESTRDGYPADRFEQARCTCGGAVFLLEIDREEGCARRTCTACGGTHFVCDSGEYAEDATLVSAECPCGKDEFNVVAGFSHRQVAGVGPEVQWITIGVRCASCGVLGVPVEWKIDHAPTAHLYAEV
jgi:hypothetical protein